MPARITILSAVVVTAILTPVWHADSRVHAQVIQGHAWLSGLWHLVDQKADEQNVPQHRVDIRLYSEGGQLRAAGINRNNGQETPYAAATFDGSTLRLQRTLSDRFSLVMTWNGQRFDGDWRDAQNQAPGPQISLKLVRGKTP